MYSWFPAHHYRPLLSLDLQLVFWNVTQHHGIIESHGINRTPLLLAVPRPARGLPTHLAWWVWLARGATEPVVSRVAAGCFAAVFAREDEPLRLLEARRRH